MIRVITFDLDDTLWHTKPVIDNANRALYLWLQNHAPALTQIFQPHDLDLLQQQITRDYPLSAHSVTTMRLRLLGKALAVAGYRGDELIRLRDQAFEHFIAARNDIEFFQDSLKMLETLKADYQLAALSNGNADIARVGLTEHFDFCLNADTVGTAKPHPLMFEQMLALTNAKPEEVIHVGDSPEHDVRGAQNVGIHSLWVNLDQKPWPDSLSLSPPTLVVNRLSDIPAVIARFNQALIANEADTRS